MARDRQERFPQKSRGISRNALVIPRIIHPRRRPEEREREREREREKEAAESASTSWQASPSTSGAGSLQRQHSKEHSRVIKRGKWSPGGEVRLFQAVSSKGNLAMTSAEPWAALDAMATTERTSDRERPKKRGRRRDYIIQP